MQQSTTIEKAPQGVVWEDLREIPRHQFLIELMLPVPWLILSVHLYNGPYWFVGPVAGFFFFLCCLRLNHEAIHNNLGLSRHWDHLVMHGLSALMMGSNHADAFCHLKHHKDTLGADDHEGHCARMTAWQVLLYGPRFPLDLNREAWKHGGPVWRRRLATDWTLVMLLAAACLACGVRGLQLHVAAMMAGQCLTAFFAVWITHQGTIGTSLAGRSQRGPLAWVAYQMFFHREHHLYPKVPVSRLQDLARRLDAEVPGYAAARRPVVPGLDHAAMSSCRTVEVS